MSHCISLRRRPLFPSFLTATPLQLRQRSYLCTSSQKMLAICPARKTRAFCGMCSADGDQPQLSRRQFALSLAAIALVGRAGSDSGTARAADAAPDKGYLTPSGLRYFDFVVGDGVKPQWGDYLQLNFAMYTISPKGDALVPVYSTFPNKKLKFRVHHGNGQLILGLEEALHSMHVGGRRRIIVPPNLSYVIPGLGPIPPSTRQRKKFFEDLKETEGTVVFDVEIVSREPNGDDPYHYYEDKTPSPEELSTMLQRIQKENIAKGLPQFQWDETKYFPE